MFSSALLDCERVSPGSCYTLRQLDIREPRGEFKDVTFRFIFVTISDQIVMYMCTCVFFFCFFLSHTIGIGRPPATLLATPC